MGEDIVCAPGRPGGAERPTRCNEPNAIDCRAPENGRRGNQFNSVLNITVKMNGDFWFVLDELQDATISQTQDQEEVTGRGGRRINTLKRNKACTVSGNNGLLSAGLLEIQTGGEWAMGSDGNEAKIEWDEILDITGDQATTEFKAVGTAGAEINALYIRDANGIATEYLEQAAVAADGKFAYDPTTKILTFNPSAYPDGTEVWVEYTRNISADVLTNDSTNYSGKARVYIDATAEDKCGTVYHVQFYFPKGDFNGEFDIEMSDSQNPHAWEFESLAGACGAGGTLWTLTVFGENTQDAD